MTLENTRFGTLNYQPDDVFVLPEGMVGFPSLKRFVLASAKPDSPFRWLQSVDEPSVAFLLAEPTHFVSDYAPSVGPKTVEKLSLSESGPRLVLTTASIPKGHPEQMTLNLAAPVVINLENRVGAQIILGDEAYTIKHRVFEEAPRMGQSLAA